MRVSKAVRASASSAGPWREELRGALCAPGCVLTCEDLPKSVAKRKCLFVGRQLRVKRMGRLPWDNEWPSEAEKAPPSLLVAHWQRDLPTIVATLTFSWHLSRTVFLNLASVGRAPLNKDGKNGHLLFLLTPTWTLAFPWIMSEGNRPQWLH